MIGTPERVLHGTFSKLFSESALDQEKIMYKLLIVEDEEYTRQGLKQLPFWTEFGIDEIVTANNGLQDWKPSVFFNRTS